MRIIAFAATALLISAGAATAAPASVTVSVSPELQSKAERTFGVRDINQLADELRTGVQREAARNSAFDGARIVLELADARPNRPTFKQMADNPSLSYESFGTGGAQIEGHAVLPDGRVVPLAYHYFETDIRQARLGGTWSDADWTIQRFAFSLRRGDLVASR